jgi:acyl-CoA synthetase (NDP forming)/RimJ/RimL family protein N-acetyltransferase
MTSRLATGERAGYPSHWEADIVLSDGRIAHVRPVLSDDADRLVEFYARVSDRSKYLRFFAPYPELSPHDVARFTTVDHHDRVALVVIEDDRMIAIGRFDSLGDGEAEVAFLVEDSQQGRGLGSVLLEHLAQAGRERGLRRFVADVLPENRAMSRVFRDAGYAVTQQLQDGVVSVAVELRPTEGSLAVTSAREHRAVARSIEHLLRPRSIAVVGASRSRGKVGGALVRHLVDGGFAGRVYPVNADPDAGSIAGLAAVPSVGDVADEVDVAILALPAADDEQAVAECADAGVRSLVVVGAGFAETGTEEGIERQEALVRAARLAGMRLLGPHSLGLVNTTLSLNASLASALPPAGHVAMFVQSGALGRAMLAQTARRGLGISTFVSAGNRADVADDDLLQYWDEDPDTAVVAMVLESLGNPRRFSRVARRVSRRTPVVALTVGRHLGRGPGGEGGGGRLPDQAVESILRQSGVLRVDSMGELLDVALLLDRQPLPEGNRVAVLGNSDALGLLVADTAATEDLTLAGEPVDLGPSAGPDEFRAAVRTATRADHVDAVLVVYAPTLDDGDDGGVLAAVSEAAAGSGTPVLVTAPSADPDLPGPPDLPTYASPEQAVRAIAGAWAIVFWRRLDPTVSPPPAGVDVDAARQLAAHRLAAAGGAVQLTWEDTRRLLGYLGIDVLPTIPVTDVDAAIAAAQQLGWPVVLKATARHLRGRLDMAGVWRHIDTPDRMRTAWDTLTGSVGRPADAGYVVQPQADLGVPVVIDTVEHPAYGPVVSFGVSGPSTELLGDRSYRMAPLSDADADEMIDEIRAAPLLRGHRGGALADRALLIDLLRRVSLLADELPEVASAVLDPVLAHSHGVAVVNASVTLAPPPSRADWYTRRLG